MSYLGDPRTVYLARVILEAAVFIERNPGVASEDLPDHLAEGTVKALFSVRHFIFDQVYSERDGRWYIEPDWYEKWLAHYGPVSEESDE